MKIARGWLALLLHMTILSLLLIMQDKTPFYGDVHANISRLESIYQQILANPTIKYLFFFCLLAPTWAVYITARMQIWGKMLWVIAIGWCAWIFFQYMDAIVLERGMYYWFIYSSIMLLLGLAGFIVKIIFQDSSLSTKTEDAENNSDY